MTLLQQDLIFAAIAILSIVATLLWRWHHRAWKYIVVGLGALDGWLRRRLRPRR